MHWKTKARIQNTVSLLPPAVSYATYYWLQRHFGGLRRVNPVSRLKAGVDTWRQIQKLDRDPTDKVFLEVGTGWMPNVPIAYWLMGAKSTVTIDLNRYLKAELIRESLEYLADNDPEIQQLFGPLLNNERLQELLQFRKNRSFSIDAFLKLCRIRYIAPGNAAKTGLEERHIDFHTSNNVFEHIPQDVLKAILQEGNRVLSNDGLFVHRIDYSDHFSHSDRSISAVNFLQYSDAQWDRYADNRYMYVNRLRHDDFLELFESAGHRMLSCPSDVDEQSLALLRSQTLPLADRFKSKSEEVLSTVAAWIVSEKRQKGPAS